MHVLCAHGDNIPQLLQSLGLAGSPCRKGSIWVIERDGTGKVRRADYIEPQTTPRKEG
jgi:hypothetical protein